MSKQWAALIRGLRVDQKLSQMALAEILQVHRGAVGRWENAQRVPIPKLQEHLRSYIRRRRLSRDFLTRKGRQIIPLTLANKVWLPRTPELAELIGILLGDGEIKKDGSLRVSFDPKKDMNFLRRRIIPLLKGLVKVKVGFESYKRIQVFNIAFVRFLQENSKLQPGSKFEYNWAIPAWCFTKEEYVTSVLRGLFDTDGYVGYCLGSVEIMFGRFSDRCDKLTESIVMALQLLGIKSSVQHTKDGRFKIRLSSQRMVLRFFQKVGTSNIKHLARFLLWRLSRYEAKIELEGLPTLLKKVKKRYGVDLDTEPIPFLWQSHHPSLGKYALEDTQMEKTRTMRNLYKWNVLVRDSVQVLGMTYLAQRVKATLRSIRKWRQGVRVPCAKNLQVLVDIAKKNKISLEKYRINHDEKR